MKDWILAVLGTTLAVLVVTCAIGYGARRPAPQYGSTYVGEGFGGPMSPRPEQQRLAALADQVAYHERCFMAQNLLPGQRLEDQPLRSLWIANNAHFSVEERGRLLVELDQAMTLRRAEPLIERVMSGR